MNEPWQWLDRPVEYEAVRTALTNESGGGIVLDGPAGVGKTTLARTVTSAIETPVRWAACTESSKTIPLGAFAPWITAPASRNPLALLSSARENLLAEPHTIIGADDAHLLDPLSATLLHQIAVDGSARLVVTVRSGEVVPDAISSLWKDGYLQRLELGPLIKAECTALVESVLGGPLEELSAGVLWDSSGGNPLFLRTMVEGAVETGALSRTHGVWQLRGPTSVPGGLASLLHERLDRAGEPVVEALRLLALCEPLDLGVLVALVGEKAVDAAELAGMIRVGRDHGALTARFSHPVLGEVIRGQIGTASGRALRGRLVDALRDRSTETAADRIRLAHLCVDGDQPIDLAVLIGATRDVVALSDLPLGEKLARAAFDRGGGLEAAELLARTLIWQGRPRQADEALADFDPDRLDQRQLVQLLAARAGVRFWALGDTEGGRHVLGTLAARIERGPLRRIVEALEATMAVHENRLDEGISAAERVLADPEAPRYAVVFATFAAGVAMPVAGRGADFARIAAHSRGVRRTTDGMMRAMVRYGELLALTAIGDLDAAERLVAGSSEFSSAGQFAGWAIDKISLGVVAVGGGRFRAAIVAFEQALAALTTETALPWQLPAQLLLARAYAILGDVAAAERVLDAAALHEGPHTALHTPQRFVARAWVAAGGGNAYAAVELARRAADSAHSAGQFGLEAEALHYAARFGDRSVAGRLAGLCGRAQGSLVAVFARHAAAVAGTEPRALDAVSAEFEEIGLLLAAADAAAQAAVRYERAGRRRAGALAMARARKLSALCDGATTPAIRDAIQPLPITAREREVTALIARGLTNREIAERLVVSVRTVEGHIYKACGKLDVTDREQLAALVWPETPA